MHQLRAVPHIFIAHQRFVIGVGYADVAPVPQPQRLLHQTVRRVVPRIGLYPGRE